MQLRYAKRTYTLIFLCIFAHTIDAALDSSFGVDGVVTTTIDEASFIHSLTLDETTTHITVAGSSKISNSSEFGFRFQSVLTQYTTSGNVDTTFGDMGIRKDSFGTHSEFQQVRRFSGGDLIAAGFCRQGNKNQLCIARYNEQGALDNTFNAGEEIAVEVGAGGQINGVVIQSDERIIVAGTAVIGGTGQCVIARYTSTGEADATFGTNGITTASAGWYIVINDVALQSDGKIVIAGFIQPGDIHRFFLSRLNSDGSIDATFGDNGIVATSIGSGAYAKNVTIQQDDRIVAVGYAVENGVRRFAIARYDVNGSLDTTFNGTGIVTTPIQQGSEANSVALQSNGSIIVGGISRGSDTPQGNISTQFTVARYTSGGTLDTTFGTNGIEITAIGTVAEIMAIMVQPDDKIVAGGFSDNHFAVARYEAQTS